MGEYSNLESDIKDELLAMVRSGDGRRLRGNFFELWPTLKPDVEDEADRLAQFIIGIEFTLRTLLNHCQDNKQRVALAYHFVDIPLSKFPVYSDKLLKLYAQRFYDKRDGARIHSDAVLEEPPVVEAWEAF